MSVSLMPSVHTIHVSLVYEYVNVGPEIKASKNKRERSAIQPHTRYRRGLQDLCAELRHTLFKHQEVIDDPKSRAYYNQLDEDAVYVEATKRIAELIEKEEKLITSIVLSSKLDKPVPQVLMDSMSKTHRHWLKKGNGWRIGRKIPEKGYADLEKFYNRCYRKL